MTSSTTTDHDLSTVANAHYDLPMPESLLRFTGRLGATFPHVRRRDSDSGRPETVKASAAALPGAELGGFPFLDPPALDTATVFSTFEPPIKGSHDVERPTTRRFRYVEVIVDEPGPVKDLLLRFPAGVPYRRLCSGSCAKHESCGSGGKKETTDNPSIALSIPPEREAFGSGRPSTTSGLPIALTMAARKAADRAEGGCPGKRFIPSHEHTQHVIPSDCCWERTTWQSRRRRAE
jgi:hypothetical protein